LERESFVNPGLDFGPVVGGSHIYPSLYMRLSGGGQGRGQREKENAKREGERKGIPKHAK